MDGAFKRSSKMTKELTSEQYLYHCVDILRSDKTVSDHTMILMFVEYGKKLLNEKEKSAAKNK